MIKKILKTWQFIVVGIIFLGAIWYKYIHVTNFAALYDTQRKVSRIEIIKIQPESYVTEDQEQIEEMISWMNSVRLWKAINQKRVEKKMNKSIFKNFPEVILYEGEKEVIRFSFEPRAYMKINGYHYIHDKDLDMESFIESSENQS